jgi:hypothetical protein
LNSLLTLWRVHPDGTEHRVILPAEARVIGGSWVGFDYHAPYNGAVSWRVEAAGFSATSGPVWVLCDSTWLISATTPGLSVQVKVAAIGDQSRPTRSGEFTPVGGDTLFISDGKRGGMVGSIAVRVPAAGVGDIVTLLADDGVILINTPGTVGWDVKWQWAQVTDQGLSNLGGWKGYPNRVVPLPFKAAATSWLRV